MKKRDTFERGFLFLLAAVTAGPVVYVLFRSFDVSGQAESFRYGLDGWSSFFTNQENWRAFFNSILLALRVPMGVVVAVLAAWLIVRVRVPGRRYFEFLFWFVFFVPTVPLTTGWILLLDGSNGLANQWLMTLGLASNPVFDVFSASGIIWVHLTIQTIPILVILLLPSLRMIDAGLEDAALVGGASSFTTLTKVVLPLSLPAIFLATSAGLIWALESFEVEQLLGGLAGINVYSNQIYDLMTDDFPREAEAFSLSTVFVVVMLALAVAYQLLLRRRHGQAELVDSAGGTRNPSYSKHTRFWGAVFLHLLTGISILVPFGFLILGSFMKLFGFFSLSQPWTIGNWQKVLSSEVFANALWTTLAFGVGCAIVGSLLFTAIAWVMQNLRPRFRDLASVFIWLPLAFPGIVLGAVFLQVFLGTSILVPLYGTLVPVVIALLIKQLPISAHLLRMSMAQGSRDQILAAKLTGAGNLKIFVRHVLPLNTPALLLVAILIFAAAVRTVDVILLLAPPNMSTLSILAFRFAGTSEFESATVVGTITAVLSLIISFVAYRLAGRVGYFSA